MAYIQLARIAHSPLLSDIFRLHRPHEPLFLLGAEMAASQRKAKFFGSRISCFAHC